MHPSPRFSLALIAACAALACGSAQAAFTVFTDRAAFNAASVTPAVDTFDALSNVAFLSSPAQRTAGPYSYRASAVGDFYVLQHAPGQVWLSTFNLVPITLSNFSSSVLAVGGSFFGVDSSDTVLNGRSITVQANSAGGSLTQVFANVQPSSFMGFVSTTPITSLVVSISGTGAYVTMNDVVLAAVPEPASVLMMLAGGLALAAVVRLRRPQA